MFEGQIHIIGQDFHARVCGFPESGGIGRVKVPGRFELLSVHPLDKEKHRCPEAPGRQILKCRHMFSAPFGDGIREPGEPSLNPGAVLYLNFRRTPGIKGGRGSRPDIFPSGIFFEFKIDNLK
jgi:hypothetical protein